MKTRSNQSGLTFEKYDRDHIAIYFNETAREVPAGIDGEETRVEYEYDTLLVAGETPSEAAIAAAIAAAGYGQLKAEAIAAGIIFAAVQKGQIAGDTLEAAKNMVIARITAYDSSSAVNDLTVNGKHMWFDKATRASISYSMTVEKDAGETTTTLYDNDDVAYVLPIGTVLGMFAQLELYAKACFNNTAAHKAAVMAKRSVNAVLSYDFTTGYPEKLSFSLAE